MSQEATTVAAIDLGSNSFHLVIAHMAPGELRIVDRLKEMVRLAGGLQADNHLDPDTLDRALACLERFGQRLAEVPADNIRAVGTNTLRRARGPGDVLAQAEAALGHPIEVISGTEEARLVYLGAAHSLGVEPDTRRLVLDIGGGSTEVAIGDGPEPQRMESLYLGCVSLTAEHFPDGRITQKAFNAAVTEARLELEPHEAELRDLGWQEATGTSGTIRAAAAILEDAGWPEGVLTPDGLAWLRDELVKHKRTAALTDLKGLDEGRAPVFPGGLAILTAAFEALGIQRMRASDGAVREGVLHDLMGRKQDRDIRDQSINALAARYHVDSGHAERVVVTARHLLGGVGGSWSPDPTWTEAYLRWAARLHEIGLDIAHSGYHKHGAYVAEHADLLGFSRQEQRLLAALVRSHRRKLPSAPFKALPERWWKPARRLAVMLRLAVLLHRNRSADGLPAFGVATKGDSIHLAFPEGWLDNHPLTRADLEKEAALLAAADFGLTFE